METKAAKKKARKFIHKVRMRIKLRTKGSIIHTTASRPRKRDQILTSNIPAYKKSAWRVFMNSIRTKMANRIAKREAVRLAKKQTLQKAV